MDVSLRCVEENKRAFDLFYRKRISSRRESNLELNLFFVFFFFSVFSFN